MPSAIFSKTVDVAPVVDLQSVVSPVDVQSSERRVYMTFELRVPTIIVSRVCRILVTTIYNDCDDVRYRRHTVASTITLGLVFRSELQSRYMIFCGRRRRTTGGIRSSQVRNWISKTSARHCCEVRVVVANNQSSNNGRRVIERNRRVPFGILN